MAAANANLLAERVDLAVGFGVDRSQAEDAVVAAAARALVERAHALTPDRAQAILDDAARHVEDATLAPLVVALLEKAHTLPQSLVDHYHLRRPLLHTLPAHALRRLIASDPQRFIGEVHELILGYLEELKAAAHLNDALGLSGRSPRSRRDASATLRTLANLVSGGHESYRTVLKLLHDAYSGKPDASIALLRIDLAQAMLEQSGPSLPISKWDACFEFVTCVDLACRQGSESSHTPSPDKRLLRQMFLVLERFGFSSVAGLPAVTAPAAALQEKKPSGRKRDRDSAESGGVGRLPQVALNVDAQRAHLADAAMALAAPPALQQLARCALARLDAVVEARSLPADDAELCALTQLMVLATLAAPLLKANERLDEAKWAANILEFLTRTLPLLASLVVDSRVDDARTAAMAAARPKSKGLDVPLFDNVRAIPAAAPDAPPDLSLDAPMVDAKKRFAHPVALRLLLLIALRRISASDARGARRLLSIASNSDIVAALDNQLDSVRSILALLEARRPLRTLPTLDAVLVHFLAPASRASTKIHQLMLDFVEKQCGLPRKVSTSPFHREPVQIGAPYREALELGRASGLRDPENAISRRYERLGIDLGWSESDQCEE